MASEQSARKPVAQALATLQQHSAYARSLGWRGVTRHPVLAPRLTRRHPSVIARTSSRVTHPVPKTPRLVHAREDLVLPTRLWLSMLGATPTRTHAHAPEPDQAGNRRSNSAIPHSHTLTTHEAPRITNTLTQCANGNRDSARPSGKRRYCRQYRHTPPSRRAPSSHMTRLPH